ncbi:response regulator receiver protein [Candidatus Moduliflexus flocculans]|uniref:Response regulator receiver protein n=1 Tax=Candidatus Moduliflexus flocculans TaxID=1499966 RepID=A0A0S6VXL3_9BACT|nr:response regulator receiver protein [Candidatus Moduliflexus flocculans]
MSKPNVLVITQHQDSVEELKTIFAREYQPLSANNGVDGVAISRLARPAVIVIERDLPTFQAAGVCKSLLANEDARSIPVLVLAETENVDGELSAFANVKGVIQRPFQAKQVMSKIQSVLSNAPTPAGKSATRPAMKRDEPIKVLSVDDSSVVRKLVTMILTAEGFKVSTASDGLDGVNKAKEIRPDIILLDFVMPKMNGFQVCRILQKDEKLRQIPVILVTSKGDKVGDKFVDQLGVTGYITKPFQPEELVSKIHQTLEGLSSPAESSAPAAAPQAAPTPARAPEKAAQIEAASSVIPVKETAHQDMAPAVAGGDLDHRVKELVKAEVDALMGTLEKQIEKLVIEKLNEYIRRAKKKE